MNRWRSVTNGERPRSRTRVIVRTIDGREFSAWYASGEFRKTRDVKAFWLAYVTHWKFSGGGSEKG